MSRYQPLVDHLRSLNVSRWNASFAEVEAILGRQLPPSAYQYAAWWANQSAGHSQTAGWRDAGWKTANLDLTRKRVSFERQGAEAVSPTVADVRRPFQHDKVSLWQRAREVTGIGDREELIEAGLRALIARHAARELVAMGGTMPDAAAAPRERPFA